MRRHGVVTVLALIFMAVFATLAIAFYSLVTTSTKATSNDRNVQRAQAAAESGMEFLKNAISTIKVPDTVIINSDNLTAIADGLRQCMPNGSSVLGGGSINYDGDLLITIPRITLHPGDNDSFTATIQGAAASSGKPSLSISVIGKEGTSAVQRRIDMVFLPQPLNYFSAGVKSRGRIDLAKGKSNVIGTWADGLPHNELPNPGSVMSAYDSDWAVTLAGGKITGNVYLAGDPEIAFKSTGGTVNGATAGNWDTMTAAQVAALTAHVQQVDPPAFPEFNFDSLPYSFLTTVSSGSIGSNTRNIYITRDTSVTGSTIISGVIRVAPGVRLSFGGNSELAGVIVCEGTNSNTMISFQGVPTFGTPDFTGVPAAVKAQLAGYSILGPSAYVYITGSGGGNTSKRGFASTIVCGTLAEFGSGLIPIRDGTLMTMTQWNATGNNGVSCWMEGDGIVLQRSLAYQPPTGGYIQKFVWVENPESYCEPPAGQ